MQGPLIGLVALCVIFSFTTSAFLSFRNLLNVLDQVTVLGILSIGMTAVIMIGGHRSFGRFGPGFFHDDPGLAEPRLRLAARCLRSWRPSWSAPFAVGRMVCSVTRAKLPAFIATLSMMTIARGLANIITDGRQIVGYPDWFDSFATIRYFGFFR